MAAVRVSWYVRVRTGVAARNMWALGGPPAQVGDVDEQRRGGEGSEVAGARR